MQMPKAEREIGEGVEREGQSNFRDKADFKIF